MTPAELVATYTKQLLTYDPTLIVIGRENFYKLDSDRDYIVVDSDLAIPIGSSDEFNGDTEETVFVKQMSGNFTLDFFGPLARTNAVNWMIQHKGQPAYEFQRDLGIAVFQVSAIRDLKSLEGKKYNHRQRLEFTVQYNEVLTIETLRIDTAQIDLIVNN